MKLLPVKSSSDIPDQGTQHDTSPRDMNEEIDLEAGVNMHGKEESIAIICYDVPRTFAEIEVSVYMYHATVCSELCQICVSTPLSVPVPPSRPDNV